MDEGYKEPGLMIVQISFPWSIKHRFCVQILCHAMTKLLLLMGNKER